MNPVLWLLDLKYELTNESGDGHNRSYTMSVAVDEETFEGTGRSKKLAKAEAAKYALIKLYNILTVPGKLFPLLRVPTSSGNHGKPWKSLKKFHA